MDLTHSNLELLPDGRPQNKQPRAHKDKPCCWEGSSYYFFVGRAIQNRTGGYRGVSGAVSSRLGGAVRNTRKKYTPQNRRDLRI